MITDENFERAQEELAYAYEKVPFFRQHMARAGLQPADITSADALRRVPPTHKAHYRRNFPKGVLAEGHTLDEPFVYRTQSSGTEGDRLVSVSFSYVLAQRAVATLAINPEFAFLLKKKQMRTCRYAAPNCSDVECSNPNSALADRLLPDGTLVLPVYHDLLTTPPAMVELAAKEIDEYAPDLLYADPTHLSFLAGQLIAIGHAPYRPASGFAIESSYTLCTAIARKKIRSFFGEDVPFAAVLAMTEFGYVGMECPLGKMHLDADDYYFELLAGDRPAEPGELGMLHVTSLGDELSPHIRYRTGDLFRHVDTPCACGNPFPVVTVEGRAANAIVRDGGVRLTPHEVDAVVGESSFVEMYCLEQLDASTCVFRYVPAEPDPEPRAKELEGRLHAALGDLSVRMEKVPYIPSDRGGKFMTTRSRIATKVLGLT